MAGPNLSKPGVKQPDMVKREPWVEEMLALGVTQKVIEYAKMRLGSDGHYVLFECQYPPEVVFDADGKHTVSIPSMYRGRLLDSVQAQRPNMLRYLNPPFENLPGGKMPLFYTPDYTDLRTNIAANGGVLHLFEGASDTWIAYGAEIMNAAGWLSAQPALDGLTQILVKLGVKSIIHYPDLDEAGVSGAYRLSMHFAGSKIIYRAKLLPQDVNSIEIKDVRAIYNAIGKNHKATRRILDDAAWLDLDFSKDMLSAGLPSNADYKSIEWTPKFYKEVIADRLGLTDDKFKANGYSKNVKCPIHDDRSPSFGWNRQHHMGYCFACGSINGFMLCKHFGLNWKDGYAVVAKPQAEFSVTSSTYEGYKTGQVVKQVDTEPVFTYLDDAIDDRLSRVSGHRITEKPPILNPFPNIRHRGGFATFLKRPSMVGIYAPSGGFKTSTTYWAMNNLAQAGEHGIVYSPEWTSSDNADRYVQMHGGLSLLEMQKMERHYYEQAMSRQGKLPVDYNLSGEMPLEYRIQQDNLVAEGIKQKYRGKIAFINGYGDHVWDVLSKIEQTADIMTQDGFPPSWVLVDYAQLLTAPPGQGGWWKDDHSVERLRQVAISRGLVAFVTSQVRKTDAQQMKNRDAPEMISATSGANISPKPFNLILGIGANGEDENSRTRTSNGREILMVKLAVLKNSLGGTASSYEDADNLFVDLGSLNMFTSLEEAEGYKPFYEPEEDIEF